MQRGKGLKHLFASLLVVVATAGALLGPAGSAMAAPSVSKQTVGHLVSGSGNGNGHFGGDKPEAFVLSDTTQGDKPMGVEFTLASEPAKSRARVVAKYVDDNNWAYVGYDAGNNWFIE